MLLAHDGAISKVAQALSSSDAHDITEAMQQSLLNKHPQASSPHEQAFSAPIPSDRHTAFIDNVKVADITECVRKFPPVSLGGGTGLTPTPLTEMLRLPEASDGAGLLTSLSCFVSQLVKGNVPLRIAPWLPGHRSRRYESAMAVFAPMP